MIQLFSKKNGEINMTSVSPDVNTSLISSSPALQGSWARGQVLIQEIPLTGITLRFTEVVATAQDSILIVDEPDAIVFHIQLQGSAYLEAGGLGELLFHERAFNYYYLHEWSTGLAVRGGRKISFLQIRVPLTVFEGFASEYTFVEGFIGAIGMKKNTRLMRHNQVSCEFMMDKIDLIKCPGIKVVVRDVVLDLIEFSLQKIHTQPKKKVPRYTQVEVDKFYEAKDLLIKEYHRNHTLSEISQLVGLNLFKLKRGFTELFGASAHTIQHGYRMKVAADLLADVKKYTIAEIAGMVGYDAAESFIRAFKKYYGDYPVAHRSKRANNGHACSF